MKNWTLALALGTAVATTAIALEVNPAHAFQFQFNGLLTSDDLFNLTLTTENRLLIDQSYPAYTDPLSGLTSPAYTFTGYRVTSVSGTYFDKSTGITSPIVGLLSINSIVSDASDLIPHSRTDNLFNPNGGFAPGVLPPGNKAGKFSFGGLAFNVQEGTEIEPYQVFTRSDFNSSFQRPGDYAGCPGTCFGVVEVEVVPEPSSTLGFLALGTLGAASALKRKLKRAKSTEKDTEKVG